MYYSFSKKHVLPDPEDYEFGPWEKVSGKYVRNMKVINHFRRSNLRVIKIKFRDGIIVPLYHPSDYTFFHFGGSNDITHVAFPIKEKEYDTEV